MVIYSGTLTCGFIVFGASVLLDGNRGYCGMSINCGDLAEGDMGRNSFWDSAVIPLQGTFSPPD